MSRDYIARVQERHDRVAPVPGGNRNVNVNGVGIVIGQQDGLVTDEGVVGQTAQPIVYGVLSNTGEWQFRKVQRRR